jgi:hypothetical protein
MHTNSCRVATGRLLELRIGGFETPGDVDRFADQVKSQLTALAPGQRVVLVADWRRCPVLTPPVAERVSAMLKRNSPQIERNALLHLSDQSASLLQLFRVIQEAENPHRRLFSDPQALERFLGELLDDVEQVRLQGFLGESQLSRQSA